MDMKRAIAYTMVTVLSFSTCTSVFASTNSNSNECKYTGANSNDTIVLTYTDHGSFEAVTTDVREITTDARESTSDVVSDIVYATSTEYDGIYQLNDDKYVANVKDDIFLLVEKEDLNLEDIEANELIFEKNNLTSDLIQSIEENIQQQKAIENEDFEVSIFAPATINTKASNARARSETSYYTYDGYNFKDTIVTYKNGSSGMQEIAAGTKTKNIASKLINLVISAVGIRSKSVSIFGAGLSALDVFVVDKGPVSYGAVKDRLSGNLIYDKYEKLTAMADNGGSSYTFGYCTSYKVYIQRCDVYQFYVSTGESLTEEQGIWEYQYSENYLNPARKIENNLPKTTYTDGRIYSTFFGGKFYF